MKHFFFSFSMNLLLITFKQTYIIKILIDDITISHYIFQIQFWIYNILYTWHLSSTTMVLFYDCK